jgi:S-formylglutathione hydrolase FrmB
MSADSLRLSRSRTAERRARERRRLPVPRWLRRALKLVLALLALIAVVLAIPPLRGFAIDQIIYQGDFFFPAHERSTVARVERAHAGAPPVVRLVPVRDGQVLTASLISRILHGARRDLRIYLPPGYGDPAARWRRYPVLYLIHGSPGNPTSWLRGAHADWAANEGIAAGTVRPLIMVMPDLNGGMWRDTECVNKWDGTDNEMSYFVHEVVPYIDRHFRTLADPRDRAIGGLSSGGYCAYNIGLHYPRLFNTLFSISGYFHALRREVFGLNDPFGHDPRFLAANSPDWYVGRVPGVRHMHLFIADSTADWGYNGYATAFYRTLKRLHIPATLLMRDPTGFHLWDHSWAYWASAFRQLLPMVSASFGH